MFCGADHHQATESLEEAIRSADFGFIFLLYNVNLNLTESAPLLHTISCFLISDDWPRVIHDARCSSWERITYASIISPIFIHFTCISPFGALLHNKETRPSIP